MRPAARVGDACVGICYGHLIPISMTGIVAQGHPTILADGSPMATISNICVGNCGHTGTIVSGSSNTTSDGLPNSGVGDSFVGVFTGQIVSGSPTTMVE